MHPDLEEIIEVSKSVRNGIADKTITVKEGNTINHANHLIISAHVLDLRERMFLQEIQQPPRALPDADEIVPPDKKEEPQDETTHPTGD